MECVSWIAILKLHIIPIKEGNEHSECSVSGRLCKSGNITVALYSIII